MRAGAELGLAAVNLPAEFHDPVRYSHRWIWLAVLALALVAAYYAAVLWFTRDRPPQPPPAPAPAPDPRAAHLARIDDLEAAVRSGDVGLREAHQRLSELVRSYVETITPLPASTMTLADLRVHAPRPLAEMIAEMYPPEFAPGQADAEARWEHAARQARGLVSTWRR